MIQNGKLKWKQIDTESFISGINDAGIVASDPDSSNSLIVSDILTLVSSNWNNNSQTITYEHNINDRNVIDITPSELKKWSSHGVIAISETSTSITFQCTTVPEEDLTFKVSSFTISSSKNFVAKSGNSSLTVSDTLTLLANAWENNSQTISYNHNINGRTIIDNTPSETSLWAEYNVYFESETSNSITFKCTTVPEEDLTFKVSSFKISSSDTDYIGNLTVSSTITLDKDDWDENNNQTIMYNHNVNYRNVIDITPSELSLWGEFDVYAESETSNSITFKCAEVPNVDLTFKVSSFEINTGNSSSSNGNSSWINDIPIMHRNIFRGNSLGNTVTAAQLAAIADGSFDDLFLGDYWTINGVNWRIADMDYYYEKFYATEEVKTTDKHHLVIVPDTALYETFYKDGNTDTTGYAGSALHSAEAAEAIVNSAFPEMMLTYTDLLMTNSQSPFTFARRECTVEAMSSAMVFGNYTVYNTDFYSSSSLNALTAVPSCRQFALFRIAPVYIQTENHYFLRDSCASDIKVLVSYSSPRYYPPNQKAYHRPFFLLGDASNI